MLEVHAPPDEIKLADHSKDSEKAKVDDKAASKRRSTLLERLFLHSLSDIYLSIATE